MKVAIVGGRDFSRYNLMCSILNRLIKEKALDITEVICGCAQGADTMGSFWAEENGIKVKLMPANWDKFGRKAGPIRNCEMLQEADGVIAFWNGFSPGTRHMIDISHRAGKLIHIEEY